MEGKKVFSLLAIVVALIQLGLFLPQQSKSVRHNQLGVEYYNKGKMEKAIKEFQRAIEINPFYAEAYNNLGAVYLYKEEYEQAIPYLEKAIEVDPAYGFPHYNLAIALHYLGKDDDAIAELKQAIQLNPRNFKAYYNMACYYSLLNKIDLAIENLRLSIEYGYSNWDLIETDSDLDNIRKDPRFKEIIAQRPPTKGEQGGAFFNL